MTRQCALLLVICVAVLVGSVYAFEQYKETSMDAMFVGTVFCPIRAEYPSYVDIDTEKEIKRRQERALLVPRMWGMSALSMLTLGIGVAIWFAITFRRSRDVSYNHRIAQIRPHL